MAHDERRGQVRWFGYPVGARAVAVLVVVGVTVLAGCGDTGVSETSGSRQDGATMLASGAPTDPPQTTATSGADAEQSAAPEATATSDPGADPRASYTVNQDPATQVTTRDGIYLRMYAYYRNTDGTTFSQTGDRSGTVTFTSFSYDTARKRSVLQYTLTNTHDYPVHFVARTYIVSHKSMLGLFARGAVMTASGLDYDQYVRIYNVPAHANVPFEQLSWQPVGTTRPYGVQMLIYESGTPWADGPDNAAGIERPNRTGRHDDANPYEDVSVVRTSAIEPDHNGELGYGASLYNPLDDSVAYTAKVEVIRSDGAVAVRGTATTKCKAHGTCALLLRGKRNPRFAFDFTTHQQPPLFTARIYDLTRRVVFDE